MKSLLIGLSALVLALFTALAADNDAAKDVAKMQGEWTMISGERDHLPLSDEFRKKFKRIAKGDETTVTMDDQPFLKAKFTLDPSKKPKTIDYDVTGGPNAGSHQLGIYELNGHTVRFCFSVPGQPRPTDFTTKAKDGRTLSLWKPAGKP